MDISKNFHLRRAALSIVRLSDLLLIDVMVREHPSIASCSEGGAGWGGEIQPLDGWMVRFWYPEF